MSQADGERGDEGDGKPSPKPDGVSAGGGRTGPEDLTFGPITNEPRSKLFTRTPLDPEESCLGCVIGAGILLVSILIWAFVYWLNAPEFHP